MTNLKKTLAVVLAFAMVLSMGFSAFAFSDVADGTKVAEAVGILSNLKILTGFEDGTFKPDETVTRAQMAAIICRTLGYEDQAKSSAGSTVFNDVAADHWASGYINVAQSLQIINGYGDGNFGPEDQVTYEQAVKMIVVALGYELDAQAKGGWSTGYLAVASREGITKNANGTVGSAAARGTVAVLVYNSLEVRLMDQSTWTTTGGQDEYAKTDETILSQYLEVQKWEGIVESTPFSTYATEGYEADADAMMTLADGAFYQEYAEGKLVKIEEDLAEVDCSLVADVNTLAGKKVIAYVGAEEDDETGNRMVYAIAEKQGANKVTKISATQLAKEGDKDYDSKGLVAYKNVGSTRINTLDFDENVMIVVNAGAEKNEIAEGAKLTTASIANEFEVGGSIEFISNDANSKVDVVLITSYASEAVVEEVTEEEGVLTFECYQGDIDDYDTEDEDVLAIVFKDGEVATIADIAANDTVTKVEYENDSFVAYYVSSKTVTGAVGSYDDEYVEIAGEEYELSPFRGYKSTEALSGKEGIFFLNVDGQISHDEAEASKGNYAVVLAAAEATGIGSGYDVEVVLADGTVATYGLATKAYVKYGEDSEDSTEKKDKAAYEYLIDKMEADGSSYRVDADGIYDSVYEITVKNGKISKLVALAAEDEEVTGKEFDAENNEYGNIVFDEATIVISIDDTDAGVEADDIMIGLATDFFVDGEGEDACLYSYDVDDSIAGLVIGSGLAATIARDSDALIITAIKTKEIDNDTAYVITGLQAGKEVTYTVYDEDGDYTTDPAELSKGDVVLTATANAEGIIKDVECLYDFDVVEGSDFVATDEDADAKKPIVYVYGDLKEVTDTKFIVEGEDAVSFRATANYTLVDLTESTKNPEVSKKTKSNIFSNAKKYDYEVFARLYDDKVVEVVAYRTLAD